MSEKISSTLFPRPQQRLRQAPANTDFIPEDYKKVAKGIEKQFAEEMLRQMNKTTGAKEGGTDAKFYRSLLQGERAQMLSTNNGGLGIQDMILEEIYPRRMRNALALKQYEQSKLQKRESIRIQPQAQANKPEIGMQKEHSIGLGVNQANAKETTNE